MFGNKSVRAQEPIECESIFTHNSTFADGEPGMLHENIVGPARFLRGIELTVNAPWSRQTFAFATYSLCHKSVVSVTGKMNNRKVNYLRNWTQGEEV